MLHCQPRLINLRARGNSKQRVKVSCNISGCFQLSIGKSFPILPSIHGVIYETSHRIHNMTAAGWLIGSSCICRASQNFSKPPPDPQSLPQNIPENIGLPWLLFSMKALVYQAELVLPIKNICFAM